MVTRFTGHPPTQIHISREKKRSQKSVVLLISMSLCCICMLCKKDQQQENRNIDDLPPLHDVEEPLNNDTGNLYIGLIP